MSKSAPNDRIASSMIAGTPADENATHAMNRRTGGSVWLATGKAAAAEGSLVHQIDETDIAFIEGVMTGG